MENEIIVGAKYSPLRLKEKLARTSVFNIFIIAYYFLFRLMLFDEKLQQETYMISDIVKNILPIIRIVLIVYSIVMVVTWAGFVFAAFKEKLDKLRSKYCLVFLGEFVTMLIIIILN